MFVNEENLSQEDNDEDEHEDENKVDGQIVPVLDSLPLFLGDDRATLPVEPAQERVPEGEASELGLHTWQLKSLRAEVPVAQFTRRMVRCG